MTDTVIRSGTIKGEMTSADVFPTPAASTALEASRRVDWRFLLPDPNLGHVAVAGKVSASLRESLSLFSQHVTYMEAPFNRDRYPQQADLVVVCGSLDSPLVAALELVKPAGYVYVEFTARLSMASLRRRHPLSYGTKLLKAKGFEDIQGHWHSPNFDGCKRIIPLDTPDALAFAIRKTENRAIQSLTRQALSIALQTGLLQRATRSLSLVARRGAP